MTNKNKTLSLIKELNQIAKENNVVIIHEYDMMLLYAKTEKDYKKIESLINKDIKKIQ